MGFVGEWVDGGGREWEKVLIKVALAHNIESVDRGGGSPYTRIRATEGRAQQ